MYIYNTDTAMWVKQTDTLNKDDYNNLKQDLAKMQLYSRALSGATYLYTSSTSSIYESISYKDNNSWYIDPISSPYNSMGLPSSGAPINSSNFNEYKNYSYEYGFTLKNLFTPTKAIDVLNTINVSVATTGTIDLTSTTFSVIDGIILKNGNLVLVKDQLSTVDLAYTVDPNLYFSGNYYFVNDNVADITYQYYSETNGIYEFNDGNLVKITMATYSLNSQLSIYVNLGTTYQDKQFSLSRLLNGYYPIEGQPFEFKECHNYLVRNQVDYHNLYETNYYDVLKHATQSLTIEGYTYTIPQRLLYVGDFGVILNQQDTTYSQYVFNNCKENLKCITQTTRYYWACGDNGTILKISKLDLYVTKIDLGEEFHNLTSISFLDDMNGIVVGKYNTIYRTFDGGYSWKEVLIGKSNYSYNRVFYYNYNLIYIAGESGVFCELKYSDTSGYTPNFINLVKNLSLTDTYDLIEDINDMYYTHFDTWGLTYAVTVDLMAGNGINYSMECLFMVTNNNIMCYEINNFVTEHAVLYLAFSQSIGNLNSITRQKGTDIMYVAGDNIISFDINTFEYTSVTSNQILGTTNNLISDSQYTNRLFDYNGELIYNVGNFASIYERNYSALSLYTAISTETITPRMLFMEYDMADKLNFFDSDYNYRLPISITFGSTQSSTALSLLKFNSIQDTALDYLIDSYKTYGVNSDTSTGNTILLNTQFEYGDYSYTYSNTDISISYNDMSGLYPFVNSKTASRYTQFTPILSSSSYSAFIYGYMSIFKLPSTFCKVGDLLQISSTNITTNVMVNYGLTTSSTPGGVILSSALSNPGSGYQLNDVFYINGGSTPAWGKITGITGGSGAGISGLTISYYNGNSYAIGDTFTVNGGISPAICQVTSVNSTSYYRVLSANITSIGTGYTVGTLFTTGSSFLGRVDAIYTGGGVSSFTILNPGSFTSLPTSMSTSIVSGTGSGLIINRTSYVYSPGSVTGINILNSGAGYTAGNIYSTTRITGVGSGLYLLVNSVSGSFSASGSVTSYSLLNTGFGYSTGLASTTGATAHGSGLTINVSAVSALSSSYTYFYAFNDLNQSILNTIKSSATLTIKNLNKFNTASVMQSNFDSHPISDAYKLSYDGITYTLSPRFNNVTAYKSLETSVEVHYSSVINNYNVSYPTTFNQFGYTPNYSLLNYLSTINSVFTASKKFYTMPEYTGLPCNGAGTFTDNNIYYDSNTPLAGTVSFPKNKLIFGNNLKYEYDTLWVNTFVDLTLITNAGTLIKTQVLITDKYYDEIFGGWALIFNDSIIKTDDGFTHYNVALNSINIISRNTLAKISEDLEIFNNLNKPLVSKKYNSGLYYMNIYDNPIKTKINTDSYTKILLSDGDIKKYISSIIYTNDKNILTMNVVNISKTEDIAINNTFIVGSNLALSTGNLQNINGSLSAYLTFNGGTGSSQELNPNYNGIHTINKLDDYDLTVNTPYLNYPSVIDTGILKVNIFDPFFNYQVVNLLDITDNNKYKIPTILTTYNFYSIGLTNSLINLNNIKPAFRLVDGLDIDTLSTNYHWILEAEISDAIIGLNANGIVWYSGTWHSGRWFGDTWYSGTWISGDWYSGTWNSVQITDKVTSVSVGQSSYDNQQSVWYNGRWFDGYWQAGTWLDGRWYNGTWNDGLWFNGIWNDGKWNTGSFYGGIWVQGYWLSGTFNAFNKPAYWIDGSFDSGDFQNGIWYDGTFGINYNTLNKFGASASNSRNAVWHGGVWASGNFYSYENINGSTVSVSTTHKYSNWRTGVWNKGNFYGGIVYNIEFQAGTWHGGIVDDIEVIGLNPITNQIILNGEFRFNIGDYINIITDGTSTPYSAIGNYNQPGRYKVALTEFDYTNNWTILTLNYDFNTLGLTGYYSATASSDLDTGLRLVSKYNNIDWYSGIWNNGIFDGGNFYGGIWYDGIFLNGTWGV